MKNTNRALLTSVVALILCCTMLVGSTFAWFTDEVTTGVSNIQAGNLDVTLSTDKGEVTNQTKLFDGITWEPGVVAYENLTVENVGNLAVKFDLSLNVGKENYVVLADGTKTDIGLSKILKIGIIEGGVQGDRDDLLSSGITWKSLTDWEVEALPLKAGETKTYGVVLYWQPSANDNDWNVNNGKSTTDGKYLYIELGANLFATQLASESDSFDNQYDALAPYPVAKVNPWPTTVMATEWIGKEPFVCNLDVAYQFLATETAAQGAASPYANWNADFVISIDKEMPEGATAGLAGYYSAWCDDLNDHNWIAFEGELEKDEEVRLVKGLGFLVEYQEICKYSSDENNTYDGFLCGAFGNEEMDGITLTVELRLYEIYTEEECLEKFGVTSTNYEKADYENDGKPYYVTVGTFTHTFTAGDSVSTAPGLEKAIEDGVTYITLTDDINLKDGSFVIPADKTTVLDLNGHALSVKNTTAAASCAINNKGTLTIKNGTVTYEGVGDSSFGYGTNTINNSGKLVIKNAAIVNTTAAGSSVAIDCSAGADLTIESGLIKSEKNAIRLCPFGSAAINCTINGGEITGARAIQIQLPSNKPADAPDIDLTITGGTFNSTTGLALYSYSAGQSFANVDVVISGGTFNGDVCFGGGNAKPTEENVTVTDGTFNGELGRYLANDGWEDITVTNP